MQQHRSVPKGYTLCGNTAVNGQHLSSGNPMLCSHCSTPNPESNRFCGECGQPLVRQHMTVPYESSVPIAETAHHQTTISGPSFLGLTDSSEEDATGYLLEEEHHGGGHTGWVVFSALAVAILAVIGWMEWRAIQTGKLPVASLQSTSAGPAPEETASNQNGAGAKSNSAAAGSGAMADRKPQSDADNEDSPAGSGTGLKSNAANPNWGAVSSPESSDAKSDPKATQDSESRLAKEAHERQQQETATNSDEDDNAASAKSTRTPKAKPVAATTKAPDPRQNRMLVTGENYLYGRGVPQDCNQALIYFRAAAEKDNAPAMSHLGAMYASGHCVTANRLAAYKWFARASQVEPSNQWISRSMNMMYRDMTPQERASVSR
jgi:Sel1 repeat